MESLQVNLAMAIGTTYDCIIPFLAVLGSITMYCMHIHGVVGRSKYLSMQWTPFVKGRLTLIHTYIHLHTHNTIQGVY